MRWAIFYKNASGEWKNVFTNSRSFKSRYYAEKRAGPFKLYSPHKIEVREAPNTINDTDRLNHLLQNAFRIYENDKGKYYLSGDGTQYGKSYETPRAAIDGSIKGEV